MLKVENTGVEPVTFPTSLVGTLQPTDLKQKKDHTFPCNPLKVENTGVEPVTFPTSLVGTLQPAELKRKKDHTFPCNPLKVENTGVEPVTSCMPCKRSSQLS